MKKLLVLQILFIASFTFAQIDSFDSSYIERLKKDVDVTSKEIVGENLKLTGEEAKIFWPLYDEYMSARNPIIDHRIEIVAEYMKNYSSMDDKTAKDLINKSLKSYRDLLDVKEKYINKMYEHLPAPLVGKYFQIDNRLSALLDLIRMSSIPLIQNEK